MALPKATCILREFIEPLKRAILSLPEAGGKPRVLTTRETKEIFKNIVKDDNLAEQINRLYEVSRTYKNATTASQRLIRNLEKRTPEQKEKIIKNLQENLSQKKDIINKENLLTFTKESYTSSLGGDVSLDDVEKIARIKKEADVLDKLRDGTVAGSDERLRYGLKLKELNDLVNELKDGGKKSFGTKVKEYAIDRFSKDKGFGNIGELFKLTGDITTTAAWKGVKASLDASGYLRQGFKTLVNDPKIWFKNLKMSIQNFNALSKETLKDIEDNFFADIVSRDLYDEAIKAKLPILRTEEIFPNSLIEEAKIGGVNLGKPFRASDQLYTMFTQGARMDLFEKFYKNAEKFYAKTPEKFTQEVKNNIAELASSMTGRGNIGALEKIPDAVNRTFFSLRFLKSQADTLWKPFDPKLDKFTRLEAQKNLAKVGIAIGGVLAGLVAMGVEVELDPRSSRFGKFRLPGTKEDRWLDATSGLGQLVTLGTRLATGETKSGKNVVSKLEPGFGKNSRADTTLSFFLNKLSPGLGTARQLLEGETFGGKKPTLGSTVENLAAPISGTNIIKAFQEEDTWEALFASLADFTGVGVTDYNDFRR